LSDESRRRGTCGQRSSARVVLISPRVTAIKDMRVHDRDGAAQPALTDAEAAVAWQPGLRLDALAMPVASVDLALA
jgi:hypothetical protein